MLTGTSPTQVGLQTSKNNNLDAHQQPWEHSRTRFGDITFPPITLSSDRYTRPLPPNRYEELQASGFFSALEAPSSLTKNVKDAHTLPGVKLGVIAGEESSSLPKMESLDDNDEEKEDQRPWNRSGAGRWDWNILLFVSWYDYTSVFSLTGTLQIGLRYWDNS